MQLVPPATAPWLNPAEYWGSMSAATAALDTPFGAVSVPALAHNAHDMLRRANGKPIRVRIDPPPPPIDACDACNHFT